MRLMWQWLNGWECEYRKHNVEHLQGLRTEQALLHDSLTGLQRDTARAAAETAHHFVRLQQTAGTSDTHE